MNWILAAVFSFLALLATGLLVGLLIVWYGAWLETKRR
jgi:hypothetical protein